MSDINRVVITGRLGRDPEVRYIQSGTAVCQLNVAVGSSWFDKQTNQRKEKTAWVDVTCWGKTAELAGEYLSKGREVGIDGRLEMDEWTDKESGQKRSKLKVVCEQLRFIGGKQDAPHKSDDTGFNADPPSTQGQGDEEPAYPQEVPF